MHGLCIAVNVQEATVAELNWSGKGRYQSKAKT
jgi:hypothetical protein